MTIFDFILSHYDVVFTRDECGNAYFECNGCRLLDELKDVVYIDYNTYFISKENYEKYAEIEITITDDESIYGVYNTRRPYYRMRGVPVTQEQAFDIIRRTDNFFRFEIEAIHSHDDYIGCMNFDNWLIMKNHSPRGYGWIHVDGTVGGNAITQKYPTVEEFICEWLTYLYAFPYLDLIVAVTYWDELPPDVMYDNSERELFHTAAYDERFYEVVLVGIYVHDKKIEILNKQDAVAKFKEYDKLYGSPREKFEPEYYEKNNISQVDMAYLRKCIESYGVDADKALSKVSKFVLKGV